jgi:pantoate--beta-alanine ligase
MGALHDGHLSLAAAARTRCDVVALTIFVNPLQFGDSADLDGYPRDLRGDLAKAELAGVTAVFAPSVREMYPQAQTIWVKPGRLAERLEGRSRPGHFEGVATVVTKLFGLAGACSAFFGEKDFQQLAIVRSLVTEFELPVAIVGCPIVREPDGLAMSSRNARLTAEGRAAAVVLSRALARGRELVEGGERSARSVGDAMAELVGTQPRATLDYAVVADPMTLDEPATIEPDQPVRLLLAAVVDGVRLIDNMEARPGGMP